jgi:hypothetical protein
MGFKHSKLDFNQIILTESDIEKLVKIFKTKAGDQYTDEEVRKIVDFMLRLAELQLEHIESKEQRQDGE